MSKSKFYDAIKDVIDERGVETPYKKTTWKSSMPSTEP